MVVSEMKRCQEIQDLQGIPCHCAPLGLTLVVNVIVKLSCYHCQLSVSEKSPVWRLSAAADLDSVVWNIASTV